MATTTNAVEVTKPKRRWLRFSLRTLMVLVLAISMPLAWLGMKVRRANEQRSAVEAIRAVGGYVEYDHEYKLCYFHEQMSGPSIPFGLSEDPPPPGPVWLRRLFGDGLFAEVVYVEGSDDADRIVSHVEQLPYLRHLLVGVASQDCPVTDASLVQVKGLTRLKTLRLFHTRVTDAGLVHLRGLSQLESLELCGTKVTDAGLVHVQGLPRLQMLDLRSTQVTDTGLGYVRGLPQLKAVILGDTRVTDVGIRRLKQALPNVQIVR